MKHDFLGNAVTVTSDATLKGIDDFGTGFLAYENQMVAILPAADADPANCLANAYAAWVHMFAESEDAAANARPYADKALAARETATDRERLCAEIADAWVRDDMDRALSLGKAVIARYPRDLVVVKLQSYHLFNRGDPPGMLRVAQMAFERNTDNPYMHGMIAFAYEQCHLIEEAEQAARRAMSLKRAEPWAHHALAHVFLTTGRIAEGLTFLEEVSDTWQNLNSFMHTHNWWHLALFYISRGRMADALDVYDSHVWGVAKDYSQDQVGAVSLLARLEFAGVDVGNRWAEPADHIAARGADTVQPFLTLQYLYALVRARHPQAEDLMAAIRNRADTAPDHSRVAWAEVALPAATGILAMLNGDANRAVRDLGLAVPRMMEIGGSHAQRDLFDQIYLEAVIRSGRLIQAQQLLELRRGFDPDGVPVNHALAKIYARLGLAPEAEAARLRAAATLKANPPRP